MAPQIPHPSHPLHLFRHMLREATYLPPLCRPWITSRIQARFRDCRYKPDPKPHIKDAHCSLRYLRSANAGHVRRMLRLCFLAMGRIGKRRRLLASSELASRPAANSAELDEAARIAADPLESAGIHQFPDGRPREPDWLDNWSVDKLKAMAHSQSEHQSSMWPVVMRRIIDPKRAIPSENSFGRPLTNKLARNKLKKHWASVLHQLLPPLPHGEWDNLRTLANGEAGPEHYAVPPRRALAQSHYPQPDPSRFDWTSYVTKPVKAVERGSSRKMKSLSGREDDDPRGHGRPIGLRVFNRRILRRGIYSLVWETSPKVEMNPRSGKLAVSWGKREIALPRPQKKDLQFFQGVDKAGVPSRSTGDRSAGRAGAS
ncbi:hypothetical protein GGS23DRAFT_601016 [Durotheca rogersii]|uniref:uncharacterized protein n=1 Tax=Durotheca rogersii TaxID=419775 RepID=UPI00222036D9|nr:uncharacterized protein GGS23DRAFT_601016 [Durotheca rogersii]KAI5856750.1 hypothetical protein GGS23DRAFT_601016 [Durotheca rogersii]